MNSNKFLPSDKGIKQSKCFWRIIIPKVFAIEIPFELNSLSEKGYVLKFVTYIDDIDIQSELEIMITTRSIANLKNAVSIFDLRY